MRCAAFLLFLLVGFPAFAADAVPASVYFPILPFDAPSDTSPQLIPIAANHAIDGVHDGVTRAIIVIHDQSRDAEASLSAMMALAGSLNTNTLILAPQFLLPSDLERFAAHLPNQGRDFATWNFDATASGWIAGDDSNAVPGHKGVSSFTVIDLLLMYLTDRQRFPDLDSVILAGYGTGGVFVQRYAAFGLASDLLDKENVKLRFVVAQAPSFLYLTANRPQGGRKGFGAVDAAICPDANTYPYGLDKLNPYARRVGANAAKTGYALRFITYLTAPGADSTPDLTCAAMAQGQNGTARADNYAFYLQSLYGDVASKTQNFSVNPKAKNDPVGLFGSSCGMTILFGDGLCAHGLEAAP
jgi:hypothetical protein